MLFNSLIFLLFALLFFGVWFVLKKNVNARLFWICIASFVFYGWWDWRFILLIIFSGLVDYFAAIAMNNNPGKRKLFLILSILGNVGSLSLFKYSGFIAENFDAIFNTSMANNVNSFFLITPVGISFYTFQSMSYTLDIYRGKIKPTKNLIHFFAYLSMFPQLVAGPIVRASDLLPQLLNNIRPTKQVQWDGFQLIVKGYFKKMVIADNLAPIVVSAFSKSTVDPNSAIWWGAVIAFAFQIYCDFAGYSDIARGLAKWMGYNFPLNFNHPYISSSLRSFWGRWHISLSTWFRDYVYIPLGGNRKGNTRGIVNMWITMLLSGLWHGAAWTYLIWGGIHALFLSLERVFYFKFLDTKIWFVKSLKWFWVLLIVLVGWVFFRAESVHQAFEILKVMFSFTGELFLGWEINGSIFIGIMIFREFLAYTGFDKRYFGSGKISPMLEMVYYGILIALIVFFRGAGSEFIYFQF